MDWMQQLGGVLNRYGNADADHADAVSDFDHVAQAAPKEAIGTGLADAFRSSQTPPFANMLGQMFGQSGGTQRAGVLNALLTTLGPVVVSQILARRNASAARHIDAGQPVTADVAAQIPPEDVEALAQEAERKDPSIVDRLGHFYADQPGIIKGLGGAALVVAMAKIAQAQARK
jgi:hypothetical protein